MVSRSPTIHTSSRDDPHTPHKLAVLGEAMRVVLVVLARKLMMRLGHRRTPRFVPSPQFRG